MAHVLVNLKSNNLEEVPDSDSALQAGTHGIPMFDPNGTPSIASDMQEASRMQSQGYTQPSPEQLSHGLAHAAVNTPGEKLGSALEGAAEGLTFNASDAIEAGVSKLTGSQELSPDMMRLRHEYNPGYNMAGNVAGTAASALIPGVGEANLLSKAGEAGVAVGGKLMGQELTRVGSIAARNIVQGAILSSAQQLGKFFYDPSQTAESAIANVGLSSAAAGAAGVALGSIPPLWNRTKDAINTSRFLQGLKEQVNVATAGPNTSDMLATAGISAPPEAQAALGSEPHLRNFAAGMMAEQEKSIAARKFSGVMDGLRDDIHDGTLKAIGADPANLSAIKAAGADEAATPIRSGTLQAVKTAQDANARNWQAIDPAMQGVGTSPESKTVLTDRIASLKAPMASTADEHPEFKLLSKAQKLVGGIQNMADFQRFRSDMLAQAAKYPAISDSLTSTLDQWGDDFIEKSVQQVNPAAVPQLQAARASYSNLRNLVGSLNKQFKLGTTNPDEFIDKLSDPLAFKDADLLSRATPADHKTWTQFVDQNMPGASDAIKTGYRQNLIQASSQSQGGEFNPQRAYQIMQNTWGPEVKRWVVPNTSFKVAGQEYGTVDNFIAKTNRPQDLPGPPQPSDIVPGGMLLRNVPGDDTHGIPQELVFPDHPLDPIATKFRANPKLAAGMPKPTQDMMPRLAALQDTLQSIPTAQGSPGVVASLLKSFAGGFGALMGHIITPGAGGAVGGAAVGKLAGILGTEVPDAVRLSMMKYAQTGIINAGAFKAMTDYFAHASTAQTVLDSAVSNLLKGKPSTQPQLMTDPKGTKALSDLVDEYQANPGKMLAIGGDMGHYISDHQTEVAGVVGRAQQYLNQIKPDTTPLGPLDTDRAASRLDQAKYQRALALTNKPLSILETLRKGNLTQDDMAVMEGVYPSLHKNLQEKIMHGIMEQKAKGGTIPYQQRLALSTYLGTNLDSTIGPMSMMTLLQSKQGGGQKPPGGGGQKKPPSQTARTDKIKNIPGNDMTMAQRAEQDRITPQ